MVSEGKTLVTEGKTLVTKGGKTLVTKRTTLRKYLNDYKASMPQIVKQRGWAKPNQLPEGPREKRPIGCFFSSLL